LARHIQLFGYYFNESTQEAAPAFMPERESHKLKVSSVIGESNMRFTEGFGKGLILGPGAIPHQETLFARSFKRGQAAVLQERAIKVARK
jgi:hypothetical protein